MLSRKLLTNRLILSVRSFPVLGLGLLALVLVACGAQEPDVLHLYNWSEYIDPEIFTSFEEEYGIQVVEDTFSSNEELLAKLQAGAGGYDLIVPSDYMVGIMIEEGLLEELDKGELTNLGKLDPTFTDPPFDPGMAHCVPYQWGTTGIGYNSDEFDEPPDSWAYIFDPAVAGEFAGQMTMLNDSREAFSAALKYLGYSINTTDEAQLAEARDLLIQQKEPVYAWLLSPGHRRYDVGYFDSYFRVFIELALADERYGYLVRKYIKAKAYEL